MDLYKVRNELAIGKSVFDLKLRVTFYARVSTDKDVQLNSLSNQIKYFTDLIKNNKNWEYIDGYIDEGISGTSVNKREQFLEMINDGKNKKFDLVLTKEISRFARDTLDSIKYTRELLDNGIGVLFLSDNINTLMPDSELRLTIMASIAQEEVRKLSERVKFGMKRSIEEGRVLGNSRITGFKKEKGKLIIVPEEAEMVRLLFEWYAEGKIGLEKIAHRLYDLGYKTNKNDYIHTTTLRRMITNPKYKGFYCTNTVKILDYKTKKQIRLPQSEWIIHDSNGAIPAIVSPELWDKANELLNGRRTNYLDTVEDKKAFQRKYAYSGLLFCSEHPNTAFRRLTSENGTVDWMCGHYQRHGIKGCASPRLKERELDVIFKSLLDDLQSSKTEIINHLTSIYEKTLTTRDFEQEKKKIEEKIYDTKIKKEKLLDLCMKELISEEEFSERNEQLNQDIDNYDSKIKTLEYEKTKSDNALKQISKLKKVVSNEIDSTESFNEKVQLLVDKIIVHKIDGDRKNIKLEIHLNLFDKVINVVNGVVNIDKNYLFCSHDENNDGHIGYRK